jgi:hypothetical protein
MASGSIDNKIKESLLKGTDEAVGLHDAVWQRIQEEIEADKRKVGQMAIESKPYRTGFRRVSLAASIAAAVFLISATALVAGTEAGQAAIDTGARLGQAALQRVNDLFVAEKTVIEEVEGIGEETKAALGAGESGYIIYFDEGRYKLERTSGKDRIVPLEKADYVPEVYMEIEHLAGAVPMDVAARIEPRLAAEYATVSGADSVEGPVKGIRLYAEAGGEWDDPVVRYYFVDGNRGTFVIKQRFFLEATEGHGARFDNMLKEFKVVDLTKE